MTIGEDDAAPPRIDLDVLRGWSEQRDPALRQKHRLPALAQLVELGPEGQRRHPILLHGPDILLGRYQSQYAPVDIGFRHLEDHQLYRMGAPQVHLRFDDGRWLLEVLSPQASTLINDRMVSHLHDDQEIGAGDIITLGVTAFEFEPLQNSLDRWTTARRELFATVDEPTLFLKRNGGCCGPFCRLGTGEPLVLGRTYPEPGRLPTSKEWPAVDNHRWDLSGLFDEERKHISFRHARVAIEKGQWTVEPLSTRHRTYVNRIGISSTIALQDGDELGLGSVLFEFHHPHRSLDKPRPRHMPAVVDWSAAAGPTTPPPEKK